VENGGGKKENKKGGLVTTRWLRVEHPFGQIGTQRAGAPINKGKLLTGQLNNDDGEAQNTTVRQGPRLMKSAGFEICLSLKERAQGG